MKTTLDTLSDYEKCHCVFRAVCEGVDCELTYAELESLQDEGFITNLKRVKKNRWSFEWTDALESFAKSSEAERAFIIKSVLSNAT